MITLPIRKSILKRLRKQKNSLAFISSQKASVISVHLTSFLGFLGSKNKRGFNARGCCGLEVTRAAQQPRGLWIKSRRFSILYHENQKNSDYLGLIKCDRSRSIVGSVDNYEDCGSVFEIGRWLDSNQDQVWKEVERKD